MRWLAHHSGIPALLVAVFLLVMTWRIFKRVVSLLLEVLVALAVLALATKLGWISW